MRVPHNPSKMGVERRLLGRNTEHGIFRYSKSIFEHHIQNRKNTRSIPNLPLCACFSEGTVLLWNDGPFIFLCIWQKPSLACSSHRITNWSLTVQELPQLNSETKDYWKCTAMKAVCPVTCPHKCKSNQKGTCGLAAPLWVGKSDSGHLALPKVPLVLCMVSWK